MNADCDAQHPFSRVCRDSEILDTFPAPVPGVDARVLATEGHRNAVGDAVTPYGLVLELSNSGWGPNCTDGGGGLFTGFGGVGALVGVSLAADGNLAPADCSTSLDTACCAP